MNVLERIFAAKLADLEGLKAQKPLAELVAEARSMPPCRGFKKALEQTAKPISLIAEVKKASPVKGVIRENFDPVAIAKAYEATGVHAMSVLTDVEFFQGSPEYLRSCRRATKLPVLRKDFTADAYHVYEARAMGADAVLLIVACLSKAQIQDYRELGEELGLDVLVEAHSLEEAELAIETGASLVGLNNRDLQTFETNLDISEQIIPKIAGRALVVSESALRSWDDIERVRVAGAKAVLIGTAFCKAADPGTKVREVMGW
jgi:indole-3-glycerol phosphate synthase